MTEAPLRPKGAARDYLKKVKEVIEQELPKDLLGIKDVRLLGAQVVIYTTNPKRMADYYEKIGELAKRLKKRIIIRTPPVAEGEHNRTEEGDYIDRMPPEEAEEEIKKILPEDCGIVDMTFNLNDGHVIIEAEKPGKVIGKNHANRKLVMKKTGWIIDVTRHPVIPVKEIRDIRHFYASPEVSRYRERFLKKVATSVNRASFWMLEEEGGTWVRITSLGGYREVGRNCHMLTTRDSKILIDCGISLGVQGKKAFPEFRLPEVGDLEEIDAIVLTHAHLDHIGALLYIIGHYKGPIYCTEPTRDLLYLLLRDYERISMGEMRSGMSSPENVLKNCITIGYKETTDISPDIRLTFFNAGHILGSAMAHFHIGEGYFNVAFTGDFRYDVRYNPKLGGTRLLDPASTEFLRLESLVMETTYGGKNDRATYESAVKDLAEVVRRTIRRGGKVLIPAFSVGRSQEVMLALRHLIERKEIPKVPVYLDGSIWKATAVHTAYPEYLSKELRREIYTHGAEVFPKDIFIDLSIEREDEKYEAMDSKNPCIIVAPAGMMNGGPVIEYFARLAKEEKNSLVFVGYQAEGTLGRMIQEGAKKVQLVVKGERDEISINMDVVTVEGFSGHANRQQLEQYLRDLTAKSNQGIKIRRLILHHGEKQKTLSFMSWVEKTLVKREKRIKEVLAPYNFETIRVT